MLGTRRTNGNTVAVFVNDCQSITVVDAETGIVWFTSKLQEQSSRIFFNFCS